MRICDILEKEEFNKFCDKINAFVSDMLQVYIQDVKDFHENESKEIFDSVWGPVSFNAGEVALLDSPLLQRLRKIKQLGLASYVYCGADYSRFAHTIGVFKLAGDMVEIINKQLTDKNQAEYYAQIVRLAALFHDCGHMYYSHVSEQYFTENPNSFCFLDIKKMREEFSGYIDNNVSLHELIGVAIVNSPALKQLLKLVSPYLNGNIYATDADIQKMTEYISCLILGQANDENLLPYCQIINGPVDADRCDYLTRDAHATNVPVAVDIHRLVHKLGVSYGKIPEEILPKETKLWQVNREKEVTYPVIQISAVEALNHLFISRSIMYNSVYYHQKVRTIETMFRMILETMDCAKMQEVRDFNCIMSTTDDFFGDVFCSLIKTKYDENNTYFKEIENGIKRINYRKLLKRACSVDSKELGGQYESEKELFKMVDPCAFGEIENETKKEYQYLCTKLKQEDKDSCMFRLVEFPKVNGYHVIPNIVVIDRDGSIRNYSEIFQTSTWIESKETRNKELYMVTDCRYRDLVFIALQKVLYIRYGISLSIGASRCSKVNRQDIENRIRLLLDKEYYNDSMPLVADLIIPEFHSRICKIADKYHAYEGEDGSIVDVGEIESFLKQFLVLNMPLSEMESLVSGILCIMENGLCINRKEFVKKISLIINNIGNQERRIYICPLGGEVDSATHMAYYFNDISNDNSDFSMCGSLQDAIKRSYDNDIIVLYDDGAYSGKQVQSIFEEYMGIPIEQRSTHESHVNPLDDMEKESLNRRQLYLMYVCFNSANKEEILSNIKESGANVHDIIYAEDMHDGLFDRKQVFESDIQKTLVKEALGKIGKQLLESTKIISGDYKPGWSQKRIEESTLGYNNGEQFVILKSSVPTYTITAFWSDGVFENKVWTPLFKRTNKTI